MRSLGPLDVVLNLPWAGSDASTAVARLQALFEHSPVAIAFCHGYRRLLLGMVRNKASYSLIHLHGDFSN